MLRCPKGTRKCHNNTCVSHNKSVDKQKFRCKKGTRKCLDNNCYSIINPSDILKPKILNPVKQLSTSELKKQIFAPYTSSSLKTQKSSIKPMTKKYNNFSNLKSSTKNPSDILSNKITYNKQIIPSYSPSLKSDKTILLPKIKTQSFNSIKNILKSSSSKPSTIKSLRKSSSSKTSSRKISSNKNKTSSYKTPSSLKSFYINVPTTKSIKKTSSQTIKTPSIKSLSSLKKSSSTIKSISPISPNKT